MKIVRLESGLLTHRLNEQEQEQIWNEVNKNISVVGNEVELFTPQDNKSYFIISETELDFENLVVKIKANEKIIEIKCTIYNQDKKIYTAVRKAYK